MASAWRPQPMGVVPGLLEALSLRASTPACIQVLNVLSQASEHAAGHACSSRVTLVGLLRYPLSVF